MCILQVMFIGEEALDAGGVKKVGCIVHITHHTLTHILFDVAGDIPRRGSH